MTDGMTDGMTEVIAWKLAIVWKARGTFVLENWWRVVGLNGRSITRVLTQSTNGIHEISDISGITRVFPYWRDYPGIGNQWN
jgi:hypothetical protein